MIERKTFNTNPNVSIIFDGGVGFSIAAIQINNLTGFWLEIDPYGPIPPLTVGLTVNFNHTVQRITLTKVLPPIPNAIVSNTEGNILIYFYDTPQIPSPGVDLANNPSILSVSDQQFYSEGLDFARRLTVTNPLPSWWTYPVGRLIDYETWDDLPLGAIGAGGARGWHTLSGVASIVKTTSHSGLNSLALTAAGVGGTASVRKQYMMLADEFFKPTPAIIAGLWFNPNTNVNLREIHLRVIADDTAIRREQWVQFQRQNGGIASNFAAYLDSVGGTVAPSGTYVIGDDDCWHWLVQVIDYRGNTDANGGYGRYRQIRIDDQNSSFTSIVSGLQSASIGVRSVTVDIAITSDNAAGCTLLVDDFVLTDLSGNYNQA